MMRRTLAPLLLLLPACLPTGQPQATPAPALTTPPAPAALTAPPPAPPPVEEGLLMPVPLDGFATGESLGTVIVSQGNPGEPGLWLRTSRSSQTAQGTVVGANGASVDVVLIPTDGVSQLSAEGYAALGLAPGSFAEVAIYLR